MTHGKKFERNTKKFLEQLVYIFISGMQSDLTVYENQGCSHKKHYPDFTILKRFECKKKVWVECKSSESGSFNVQTWLKQEQAKGIKKHGFTEGFLFLEDRSKQPISYTIFNIDLTKKEELYDAVTGFAIPLKISSWMAKKIKKYFKTKAS